VALFAVSPILGVGGILIAGLITYSRLYLGVHYPSDLLGGALLGSGIALALKRLYPEFVDLLGMVETSRLRRRK
jgi:membrane-associated phospholipid phosphatase